MKHISCIVAWPLAILGLTMPTGCDAVDNAADILEELVDLIDLSETTVTVVNASDTFRVDGEFRFDSPQELPRFLLEEFGARVEFDLGPGERISFSEDCDDLQAILLDDADLRVALGISPDVDSDVLRDGDDFGCGDEIIFTFTHPAIPTDLDVDITVVERSIEVIIIP